MTAAFRNTVWFVAFVAAGILVALLAMAQGLRGGLALSLSNAGYCLVHGSVAGLVFGSGFLLCWVFTRFSTAKSRWVQLVMFSIGWYFVFYIHVVAGALV